MHSKYIATIIGAGPAGVSLVGKLLDHLIHRKDFASILWIDPEFKAGRLSNYKRVPSNTKVKLFLEYCSAGQAFKEIGKLAPNNPCAVLSTLDPEQGCYLGHAVEAVQLLTQGLQSCYNDIITSVTDMVTGLQYFSDKRSWMVSTRDGHNFESEFVFLAIGSHPRAISECDASMTAFCSKHLPSLNENSDKTFIDLDSALDIDKLGSRINSTDTVVVFGLSHSAMLVVMNLSMIQNPPKRVIQISRNTHSFKYAVDMGDWILYDNTGLKGKVATWTKQHVDVADSNKSLPFEYHLLTLNDISSGIGSNLLELVTRMVFAIGYARNPLPRIEFDDQLIRDQDITHDGKCGQLKSLVTLHGLFGYGIAFPEKVVDVCGNREDSVGLVKFSRYLSRIVPSILQK